MLLFIALASFAFAANTTYISLPSEGLPQYAPGALALFAIGFVMFVCLILFAFTNILPQFESAKLNMLTIFVLGLLTAAVLIFSSFYQVQMTQNAYQITSANTVWAVQQTSITTTPLATNSFFGPIIYLLAIASIMLAFVLPGWFAIGAWRRRRYGVH